MLITVLPPLVLGLWIVTLLYRDKRSSLCDIPNAHILSPYTSLWLRWLRWRGLEHRTRVDLHRKLGPVVRLAPQHVSVNCIDEGVRIIYSARFDKDPAFYNALVDQMSFLVTMVSNDAHRQRKRMISWPYSNSCILHSSNLDAVLSRTAQHLRAEISSWAGTGLPINVFHKAKCCTLDVASGWITGAENMTYSLHDPTFQDDLSRLAVIGADFLLIRTTLDEPFRQVGSWLRRIAPPAELMGTFQEWLTNVLMASRKQHDAKPVADRSLYDYFYDSFQKTNPEMRFHQIASYMAAEVDDHIAACHFGLGITLAYAMYELSRDVEVQRVLREELLTVAGQEYSRPLAHRLASLPFLDAVLTETLRTRAPCPGPFPRIVPEGGCRLVDKYDIPAGTTVSSTAWALHLDPLPFASPDEWKPQRWIESDEKTVAEMRKWIWTFGSGARICIGTHFSLRVVKELLYAVYTDFETTLDESYTGSVDQEDAFSAGPASHCLPLKFNRVKRD